MPEYPGPSWPVPTATSVSRINSTLGLTLPKDFVEFAQQCRSYGILFASIGDDFENSDHILRIKQHFHDDDYALPPWFVIFNYGHDEACDGFDTRERNAEGQHPILYWDASQGASYVPGKRFSTFREYLENTIVYYARVRDRELADKIISPAD